MNQDELLATRYGRTKQSKQRDRRFAITVAASALAAFLIWGISTTWMNAERVTAEVRSFEVLSPQQTQVSFVVKRVRAEAVTCQLEVLDSAYTVVGYREATVLSNAPDEQTVLVNTTALGVTGVVKDCWFK